MTTLTFGLALIVMSIALLVYRSSRAGRERLEPIPRANQLMLILIVVVFVFGALLVYGGLQS